MSVFRRLSVAAALAPSILAAQGQLIQTGCVVTQRDQRDARPIVACVPGAAQIVRTGTDVRVSLVAGVLRYDVEERFVNRGGRVGEADYIFPLPKGAAFQDLQLQINGELVAGETMNATEARAIYEEIVRRQRDPALVEWMGNGLLRARIFPIAPGEEKRVVIRFQSAAQREGDALRVDWFGGTAPAGTPTPAPVGRVPVAAGTVSFTLNYPNTQQFGRAYSPTHDIDLADRGADRVATVRGDARDVTVLIPTRRAAEPSITALAHAPGNEDGFALITVAPPAADDRSVVSTPRDVTLVLDISGSMSGQKMTQARAAARQLLETLRPTDRFRLVDFATDVHTFRDAYALATPENLRAARGYIDALEASGSTNIDAALREAMRPVVDANRLPLVLFITDGEPTIGERDPVRLVDLTRPTRGDPGQSPRRIFTFGVGADVNISLLEQLALEGAGTSHFVRPEESVERSVALVASRLVDPVLTNVRVRAEGAGSANVQLSRVLSARGLDIFAGQDLIVLARYHGSGPARIVVEGTRAGRPIQWTQNVDLPANDRSNLFVARLWATQRVGFLAAEKRRAGASAEVDREIRELGERYGIPTEFTSYFVREPGMVVGNAVGGGRGGRGGGGGGGGGGRAQGQGQGSGVAAAGGTATGVVGGIPAPQGFQVATATAARTRADTFEAARAAADQRQATTLASAKIAGAQVIGGHTFQFRDSTWTDLSHKPDARTVAVRPYSAAWFALVSRLPELKAMFALGDRVIVAGRKVSVSVLGTGAETLTPAELDRFVADW